MDALAVHAVRAVITVIFANRREAFAGARCFSKGSIGVVVPDVPESIRIEISKGRGSGGIALTGENAAV